MVKINMEEKDFLKLDNQICFRLYTASRFMTQIYSEILEDLELTYPQYLVMMVLWEHKELSVKEIGNLLYLDSGTLTPLLKKIEQKDLVKRIRSEKDERIVKISITKKAIMLYEKALKVPEKLISKSNMEIKDILNLRDILDKFIVSYKKQNI